MSWRFCTLYTYTVHTMFCDSHMQSLRPLQPEENKSCMLMPVSALVHWYHPKNSRLFIGLHHAGDTLGDIRPYQVTPRVFLPRQGVRGEVSFTTTLDKSLYLLSCQPLSLAKHAHIQRRLRETLRQAWDQHSGRISCRWSLTEGNPDVAKMQHVPCHVRQMDRQAADLTPPKHVTWWA